MKKKRVNLPLIEVFIASVVLHVVALFALGSFVVYRYVVQQDTQFDVPELSEKIDPKQLERKVQLEKANQKSRMVTQKIQVKSVANIDIPEINLDLSSLGTIDAMNFNLGAAGTQGELGGGGIELSMPEINVLGIKSKGERFFFIVSAGDQLLTDSYGGVPAYNLIKKELMAQIETLPPSAVFNVMFYRGSNYFIYNQGSMVAASDEAKQNLAAWMDPINKTHASRGLSNNVSEATPDLEDENRVINNWLRALQIALAQGTDTVYIIANDWEHSSHPFRGPYLDTAQEFAKRQADWERDSREIWERVNNEFNAWLAKENAERRKRGKPEKVIGDNRWGALIGFDDSVRGHFPPRREFESTPYQDIVKYVVYLRRELYRDRAYKPTVNVIYLTEADGSEDADFNKFNDVARRNGGRIKLLRGLKAIQNVTGTSG